MPACRAARRSGVQRLRYCQARRRIPLAVFLGLVEGVAAAVRGASEDHRWRGHRVWVGLRWLTGMTDDGDTPKLVVNPCRRGR
ncbi:hypothetical protein [Paludisphaera rhizosphaerae]|uniref:hypothetical protein n=1 Tax=Paludisphaera rhizosphaerae TaxID=2711216 RepID=UPI0013EBA753|nr:hypothetical protein [Paludisphaera rhizosphaerae]